MQSHRVVKAPSWSATFIAWLIGGFVVGLAIGGPAAAVYFATKYRTAAATATAYQVAAERAVADGAHCGAQPVTYILEGKSPKDVAAKLGAMGKEIEHQRMALLLANGSYKP